MRTTLQRRPALALMASALGMFGLPGRPARAANPLAFQASWVNDAEFMGYFVAADRGYYTAEGLDLEYLSGGPDVIPESTLLGGRADVTLTTPDGATRKLPSKGAFGAPAGSVIDMVVPGSGGFGPVEKRDPKAVGRDLLEGYISERAARENYGVADPQGLRAAAASEDRD